MSEKIIRADALTDALRVIQIAIGDAEPHAQIYQAIGAIKTLRAGFEVRVQTAERVDYLDRVQVAARGRWVASHGYKGRAVGDPPDEATATVDTPLGPLEATVWRQATARGMEWKSSYSLDGKPIGVRDIKLAGLAQRPTSRNRGRKIA